MSLICRHGAFWPRKWTRWKWCDLFSHPLWLSNKCITCWFSDTVREIYSPFKMCWTMSNSVLFLRMQKESYRGRVEISRWLMSHFCTYHCDSGKILEEIMMNGKYANSLRKSLRCRIRWIECITYYKFVCGSEGTTKYVHVLNDALRNRGQGCSPSHLRRSESTLFCTTENKLLS